MKELDDLLIQVGHLTHEEQENWKNYVNYRTHFRKRTLDNINQLGFIKREIEKKILKEYQKPENTDKLIAGVSV